MERWSPESITAQALGWIDEATRAITPPIHVSSTYLRDADNQYRSGRIYARDQNPAFDQAEAVINALEGGHQTLLFASGMAAATAVFQALAPGDHVLAPKVMYWSLRNWLLSFAVPWGLEVELIDMTDPAAGIAASDTDEPLSKLAPHEVPQSMPAGLETTVPVPAPERVTFRVKLTALHWEAPGPEVVPGGHTIWLVAPAKAT